MSVKKSHQATSYRDWWYIDPPRTSITLPEFISHGSARYEKHTNVKGDEAARSKIEFPLSTEIARDVQEHYVMRLVYCLDEPASRDKFFDVERDLFKMRMRTQASHHFVEIAKAGDIDVSPTSDIPADVAAFYGASSKAALYEIPMEHVLDLVSRRRVVVRAGFAYVTQLQLIDYIGDMFRRRLSQDVARLLTRLRSVLERDSRLRVAAALIRASDEQSADYIKASGTVDARSVNRLADRSFPLCMQQMYAALKRDSHLKHDGRRQFGAFLKGIGLPLDEAVVFFRAAFAGKMTGEQFDKEHLYNVQHMYGKKGKMQETAPFGCSNIISKLPPTGVVFGCPFRSLPADRLRLLLEQRLESHVKDRIARGEAVKRMTEDVERQHYGNACSLFFAYMHGGREASTPQMTSPNRYYSDSAAHFQALEDAENQATPAVVAATAAAVFK